MSACVTSFITYPLSAAQTEIWLAQQLHPDSPVYNIAQYTVIEGAVEPALYEAAVRQVIGEADSLRLQFGESDEGLRQSIGSPAASVPLLDFSAQTNPRRPLKPGCAPIMSDPWIYYAGRFFSTHC